MLSCLLVALTQCMKIQRAPQITACLRFEVTTDKTEGLESVPVGMLDDADCNVPRQIDRATRQLLKTRNETEPYDAMNKQLGTPS
jgi:hypothetical protein